MAAEWDNLEMVCDYRDEFLKMLWPQTNLTPPLMTIVDFGCGTGLLIEHLCSNNTRVIGIDASPSMIEQVSLKIKTREWTNVEAFCAVLADLEKDNGITDEATRQAIQGLSGQVDLIVASSVLNFIPASDQAATMRALETLLKPKTGILIHSDWPVCEKMPDGMTHEQAMNLYSMGGLNLLRTKELTFAMGGESCPVYVGVAQKM
ncbi:unnamed protein product [Discosporangium mesarthrocarpum]